MTLRILARNSSSIALTRGVCLTSSSDTTQYHPRRSLCATSLQFQGNISVLRLVSKAFQSVFRTVQSVRLGGRTGRTASGSPAFFKFMDGLGQMEIGPDALPGPVGPYGVWLLHFSSCILRNLRFILSSPSYILNTNEQRT